MRSDPSSAEKYEASYDVALRWLPWLFALAAFAFDVAAYWPGAMSFDSAYAWWQARGNTSTNIAPPLFVAALRACHALGAGPWLLFVFHLALYWGGIALLARALHLDRMRALMLVLVMALAPVPLLLRAHVWTDVGLFSALVFATAALACAHGTSRRGWIALALPALFYSAALRFNALPAVLPMLAWAMWLYFEDVQITLRRRCIQAASGSLITVLMFVVTIHAVNANVDRRVPMWPLLAEFDLAAVSIGSGQMLLPVFLIGPGLDVADLTQAFRPWSAIAVLTHTRHGIREPFTKDFSDAELIALRGAWFDAIKHHSGAWLAHRAEVMRALVGSHAADWPRELIYVDAQTPYRDNPQVAPNTNALHAWLMRNADHLRASPLLAAWSCLAPGLVALPFAWRRRRHQFGQCPLLLLASAWAYALPFAVLAPSAELRYLGWPCVASLLAVVIVGVAPRRTAR